MLQSTTIRSILPRRYFTLAEANQILLLIRSQFEIAVVYNRRLDRLVTGMSDSFDATEFREKAAQIRDDIDRVLTIVRKNGVEVGNLSPGTLDFPALRNGEQVYISWRMGDRKISWWRPMEGSRSHRKLVTSTDVCWEWKN